MCDLSDLFGPYPAFALKHGDFEGYRRLRAVEQDLVSAVDKKRLEPETDFGVVTIEHAGRLMGAGSFVVESNPQRKEEANRYGRVDLIIVDPEFRGLGLGRLVILAVLLHLLKDHGGRLYSISSLAAHGAVARVLEEVGFHGDSREEKNFVHESMALNGGDHLRLADEIAERFSTGLQLTNFRLRQRETPT